MILKKEHPWDCYNAIGTDIPVFISFNSGIANEINILPFSHLLSVKIEIKEPTENGLPGSHEFPKLNEIEDSVDYFYGENGHIKVGRLTTDGGRYCYYYGNFHLDEISKNIEKIKKTFNYDINFTLKEVQNKDFYWKTLYPTEEEWQIVANQRLLMSISENGDSFTMPRKIDHLVKFKDKNKCHDFSLWAMENGYEIKKIKEEKKDEDGETLYKFTLLFNHEFSPKNDSINDITLLLYWKAKEYEGEYDGWGTLLVELENK